VLVGLGVSGLIINGTAPAACDQASTAFQAGMRTDVSGDDFGFVSRCDVTDRSTGTTTKTTAVNWSGIIASVAGCIAAWLFGAAIGGLIDRRPALAGAGVAFLVSAGALATFFA
jgi:hypothetical protein